MKQLNPSQIDREQLITREEIDVRQPGETKHMQRQTGGKQIHLWVDL